MTLRFCSTKILNVTAVQFSGYGWIEALKEIYPGVEVQITPYVSAVTLFWNKQHRYLNPNDWAVVHDGELVIFTPEAFDLVFGDSL